MLMGNKAVYIVGAANNERLFPSRIAFVVPDPLERNYLKKAPAGFSYIAYPWCICRQHTKDRCLHIHYQQYCVFMIHFIFF